MEKQILNVLLEVQKNINDLQKDMNTLQKDMKDVKSDVVDIKGTVNRIETSQTEDVVALLKLINKKTDDDFHYLNNRITQNDKRLFILENRENK
ncbi:hypothetical protein [Metabacillus schmidteae]|uniref:hypothetical protein n=1 Tax=Metabacillus schmidteae TaxID=2730405 RepID=UPI00158D7E6E|nr:hypothetical protein [Metabacillus schmidteae]